MLPISEIELVQCEHLNFGDVALVHDHENQVIIVGQNSEGPFALYVADDTRFCNLEPLYNLGGVSTRIAGCEFQVDASGATDYDYSDTKRGALVFCRSEIRFIATPPSNRGYFPIKIGEREGEGCERAIAFPSWRIVKRIADREIVIFDSANRIRRED